MPCLQIHGGTVCRPPAAQPLHLATERVDVGTFARPRYKTFGPYKTAHQRVRCHRCRRRREARHLLVTLQAYYDPFVRCADGCAAWKRRRNRLARARRAARVGGKGTA